MKQLPEEDLQHIFIHTGELLKELRNKSVFITGGTGFIGKWFIESFLYINKKLDLNASISLLTRNKNYFISNYPHLALDPSVSFVEGDIADFDFPNEEYHIIIHAAIDYKKNSIELYDSCVNGTRHILNFARICSASKFLFISSGAVYGIQPSNLTHVNEEFTGAPDPFGSNVAYGIAKRASEFLASQYSKESDIQVKIARCFAFAGPYLPLDKGAAIGNFIGSALAGTKINIRGDGTPYRSYMYASDLMIWLWTILFKGVSCRPYNVGSEEEISISNLAFEVAAIINKDLEVEILKQKDNSLSPDRYIPCTFRARKELNLDILVPRKNAIDKMANWYSY